MKFLRLMILTSLFLSWPGFAQNYQPTVGYNSMMNIRFYEQNGGLLINSLPIFFPPKDMDSVSFEIVDAQGNSKMKSGVSVDKWQQFSIVDGIRPKGSAGNVRLGKTGDYVLQVSVAGNGITRIPFSMSSKKGGDPFNPQLTFTRKGPWDQLGFITSDPDKPDAAITFNWWANTSETPNGKGGKMTAVILKDGKEVAQSKGFFISKKTWQAASKPMKKSGTNMRDFFTLADLTANDGHYDVVLKAGKKTIRSYALTVAAGKVQPHPRSSLDYKPHTDYIVPKVIFNNSGSASSAKMIDAYWLDAK